MSQETVQHQPARPIRTMPSKAVVDTYLDNTVPSAAYTDITQPMRPVSYPQVPARRQYAPVAPTKRPRRSDGRWLVGGFAVIIGIGVLIAAGLGIFVFVSYSNGILPGVEVAGISVGGLSVEEAESLLSDEWRQITLEDGERRWTVDLSELGLQLNATATAQAAYQRGRGTGRILAALFATEPVVPQLSVDEAILQARLAILADRVGVPAKNAGVAVVDGIVQATAPEDGRQLDIAMMTDLLLHSGAQTLERGVLELPMRTIAPQIQDATPILESARALLSNPLVVRVYDPVTGDIVNWTQSPENWATWLTAESNDAGFTLTADAEDVRAFLTDQARVLDSSRFIKFDEAVEQITGAIQNSDTRPTIRVYHHDRTHTVAPGDSIISIAWDYGIPYPWVQQANPDLDQLTIGQTITIPSTDNFLPFAVVPDKRIVVSISQQHAWIYENGALKWDWAVSTGINSSPTWPGIYQIISHFPNAYAANWDLYMPQFMGVYQPIPGADFTNGFHGFPTRGGGQLLWENSLGTRVTYGCILLSNTNVQLLYDWAEEGVVVEIQP